MKNPFVLNKEDYKRNLNPLKDYVNQCSLYLSKMTGKSIEECKSYVVNNLKQGGKFEFKDPAITYLERQDNGDRIKKNGTMYQYIVDSIKEEELIAPTLTTYLNPKVKQSVLVGYIDQNVKLRSVAKKAMFKAKLAGDKLQFVLNKNKQNNKKIANNSISGAHVSNSTVLFNKTGHSTLTSNCRSTSGYGNANNEKMLMGNRHYWNPNIVINNITSIIANTNYQKLSDVVNKYGLKLPSVDDVMDCITYSTNLYWSNKAALQRINTYVSRLTGLERAAFLYTGDLYHIRKLNDSFLREFITKLTSINKQDVENPSEKIEEYKEEYQSLVKQFFYNDMKGKSLKDIKGTDLEKHIASTLDSVYNTIIEYSDFIDVFLVSDNVPASLAYFPSSIRRSALTSDTDSTIFTVQDWVNWYQGDYSFNEKSMAISATMIFIAAESITHVLARMSANFGIETKRIHQVAMKNEYAFPVFVPTQVGKHYFAAIAVQEGNIYKDIEMEIKGVHLKSSNVPKTIMKKAEDMMEEIVRTLMDNKKISILKYLKHVADIEREISRSLLAGESTYFRKAQIKIPEAYTKSAEESPYQHHLLWQEVFAPKYSDAPVAPYSCLKISVDLGSRQAIKNWIASIEDKALALRLEAWVNRNNKGSIQSFLFSEETLALNGMPLEITKVMDIRKTVFDLTSVFYIILETLGVYMVNKNKTRLISDEY